MNKGISSISYDQFGNPFKVTFGNKSSIEYVYSADGVKLKARHITAIPQSTGSSSSSTNYIMSKDSTDYIGDFIYHNNKFSKYNWENGYIVPTGSSSGYAYRFYFKDHQGNNRLVTTSTGTVKQTTHYYPDGVTHDKSTGQGEQVYKYNGKELDRMHGLDWYDYGAREYDPTIGQFISMDPLCEKYYNVSPYAYCAGNPVRYVDPDGRTIQITNKDETWTYTFGTTYDGQNKYIRSVYELLNTLKDRGGEDYIKQLIDSKHLFTIKKDDRSRFKADKIGAASILHVTRNVNNVSTEIPKEKIGSGGIIFMALDQKPECPTEDGMREIPNYVVLGHEIGHAMHADTGWANYEQYSPNHEDSEFGKVTNDEFYAMKIENYIREQNGQPRRTAYSIYNGKPFMSIP